MAFEQTLIIGNLGRDPELQYMQSGDAVCRLSVAVNKEWKDKNGEKKSKTNWYRVSVWGKQAESCNQYLSKGRQVMVIGEVSVSAYRNNQGEPAASLELRAREVKFLGGNGQNGSQDGDYDYDSINETMASMGGQRSIANIDDIPF